MQPFYAPACKRIGMGEDKPYCVHGPMSKQGFRADGKQNWVCTESKRLRNKRDKDRRTHFMVAGFLYQLLLTPEQREVILTGLGELRSKQRNELGEVNQVWLDQLDNLEK